MINKAKDLAIDKKVQDILFDEIYVQDCYKLQDHQNCNFDYIFDIGANIGFFSLVASKVFPNSYFVCVEPNECLNKKLEANRPKNSYVLNFPFGRKSERRIIVEKSEGNIFNYSKKDDSGKVCICLNDIVNLFSPKNYMIKIDTQGAEEVLFNDEELMKNHYSAIDNSQYFVGEFHNFLESDVVSFGSKFKNHAVCYKNNILYLDRKML